MSEELIQRALQARLHAYAPYSGFLVGAAVRADDGREFCGANVENASYGLTVCAERVAIFGAVAAGCQRVVELAVVADTDEPVPPCGACRQVIHEFGPEAIIHMATVSGKRSSKPLRELLPGAFGPEILERTEI